MMAIMLGGILGYLFTHTTFGALLGAFAGWYIGKRRRYRHAFRQEDFVPPLFAFLGVIAKSDGRVSENEIRVAEQLMERMRLGPEQRQLAIDSFNQGKQGDYDVDQAIEGLRAWVNNRRDHAITIVDVALDMVFVGGATQQKFAILKRLTQALRISEMELMALMAMKGYHWDGQAGQHQQWQGNWQQQWQQQGRGYYRQTPPRAEQTGPDPYVVLGIGRDADARTIKRAYRKLIAEHHPDRLGDMPDNMRERAEKRAREINAAYEKIKVAKGFK